MKKEALLFVVMLGLLAVSASAQEKNPVLESPSTSEGKVNLVFRLVDFQTKNISANQLVLIEAYNLESGEKDNYYGYTDSMGILDIAMRKGEWKIILMIDDMDTPGKDYYVEYTDDFYGSMNKTLFIFPVGSISGLVLDKLENVVGNAELKFDCTSHYGRDCPENSDDFGSFKVDFVPVGECRIYASYAGAMGMGDVEIEPGRITDVTIMLDKTIVVLEREGMSAGAYLLLGFVSVVIAYILIIFITKRKKKAKGASAEKVSEETKPAIDKRMKDIIATLRKDEKSIVEFLIENSNNSTQAKVYHATGMPKTTLHRQIQSLEQKNIITIEKIGKMKKIALTSWFLGREQK